MGIDPEFFRKGWFFPAIGCLAGLALAVSSLMSSAGAVLPKGSAARVNGILISETKYLELLNAFSQDRRSDLTRDDRLFVLERMIEEELLVQQGQSLGMLQSNQSVRASLVNGIRDSITNGKSSQPNEEELQDFYSEQIGLFTPSTRLKLRQIVLPMTADGNTIAELLVDGSSIAAVKKQFHVKNYLTAPRSSMPVSRLLSYLGPTLLQAVMELEPGEFTKPIISNNYQHIIYLENRREGVAPPFEKIRDQVEARYWKTRDTMRFRKYLDQLKQKSLILRGV
ncbi:MAG: peptidylprolyl isomerase [Desulfobacula sp.]|uniref:peptidylprolyl isomerase n=1 Tax=Desulfobacula sp. TaxID=2593537 RepID=UPI0025C6BA09|nr:peptidylprolyl isomerase [Desulfobacula sp.]MCD4722692.1 peptidylprolyl isomerase [Desulfobacula sp.]